MVCAHQLLCSTGSHDLCKTRYHKNVVKMSSACVQCTVDHVSIPVMFDNLHGNVRVGVLDGNIETRVTVIITFHDVSTCVKQNLDYLGMRTPDRQMQCSVVFVIDVIKRGFVLDHVLEYLLATVGCCVMYWSSSVDVLRGEACTTAKKKQANFPANDKVEDGVISSGGCGCGACGGVS